MPDFSVSMRTGTTASILGSSEHGFHALAVSELDTVRRGRGPDIHGVPHSDVIRADFLQPRPGGLLDLRHVQIQVLHAKVGQGHEHRAGGRQEAHAVAHGQGHHGKGLGRKNEMGIPVDPDDSRLPECAFDDPVVRGEGSGMGDGRLSPFLGGSSLEHDDGFPLGQLGRDFDEPLGPLEALQVHENGLGLGVVGVVFQHFGLVRVHLVAQPHDPRYAEVLRRNDEAHGVGGEVAGLGEVGNVSLGDPAQGEEARREIMGRGSMAGRVRADNPHPGFFDGPDEFFLEGLALVVHFSEASRRQHDRLDPLRRAVPDRLGIHLGGQNDNGHVDPVGQLVEGLVGRNSPGSRRLWG